MLNLWKTLVRIIGKDDKNILVCLPGWDPDATIFLPLASVPEFVQGANAGDRFHAKVNLGEHLVGDLVFEDWGE